MRHLDGHEPPALVIVGQINKAESTFAQHPFDPVATEVAKGGLGSEGRDWFPSRVVNGLVKIVHGSCPWPFLPVFGRLPCLCNQVMFRMLQLCS
jgi:hypothetical protein